MCKTIYLNRINSTSRKASASIDFFFLNQHPSVWWGLENRELAYFVDNLHPVLLRNFEQPVRSHLSLLTMEIESIKTAHQLHCFSHQVHKITHWNQQYYPIIFTLQKLSHFPTFLVEGISKNLRQQLHHLWCYSNISYFSLLKESNTMQEVQGFILKLQYHNMLQRNNRTYSFNYYCSESLNSIAGDCPVVDSYSFILSF